MSTENEMWQENSTNGENASAGRDGNQFNGSYNRTSYNRENGERPYRPRFTRDGGERPQRTYSSERSYRPRFNPNAENSERPQRSYSERPSYGNSERPYRPRYNNENGERPQRPYGERPQRPRFNNDGERPQRSYGERPSYGGSERPFRPRYNNEAGERPQRSYGERPSYGGSERPFRPRFNSEGGERPQRPFDNRQPRPRFNANGNKPRNNRPQHRTGDYDPNAKYSKKKQIEYKEQYVDPNEPIRLNKFLANAGVCSRREADEFITAGVVSVNGTVVTELGTKIKRGDEVKFHDQAVSIERKIYILLNKPKDTVTTSDDPQARRTVMDLVKGACPERIYPVGRLDRNTTGVLLLTNDGDLASKLTHPMYLKKKIYHVHLDKNLTKADMEQIAAGIQLDDGEIHADAISYTDEAKKDDVGIEIHSGKNRIVRRIFESLGYKVTKLDRVYFAGLTKKGLRRGEWRFLNENEVNFLRMGSFE
ncbi:MAG: RNA-binding S4 domain-containing protein [Mediterranea sp.]|nr:RNA-binding S4 domain-containing protein [Mediterranea sp.]